MRSLKNVTFLLYYSQLYIFACKYRINDNFIKAQNNTPKIIVKQIKLSTSILSKNISDAP